MTNPKLKKSNTVIYVVVIAAVALGGLMLAVDRSTKKSQRGDRESSRRWGELNRRMYHPELADPDAGDRGDGEARR